VTLVAAIAFIRIVCRHRSAACRSRCLLALTGSVALFHALAPAEAPLAPYLRFLVLFSLAYGAFKVVEVLVVDLLPGRASGRRQPSSGTSAAVVGGSSWWSFSARASVSTWRRSWPRVAALSIVLGFALQGPRRTSSPGSRSCSSAPSSPVTGSRWASSRPGPGGEPARGAHEAHPARGLPDRAEQRGGQVQIVNMSQPLPIHGHAIEVNAPYGEPPDRVRMTLIEAALDVAGVLRRRRGPCDAIRQLGDRLPARLLPRRLPADLRSAGRSALALLVCVPSARHRHAVPGFGHELARRGQGRATRVVEVGRIAALLRGSSFSKRSRPSRAWHQATPLSTRACPAWSPVAW
jgi:hypothetical protein